MLPANATHQFLLAVLIACLGSALVPPLPAAGGVLDDLTRWEEGRSRSVSSARKGSDGRPDPASNSDSVRRIEPGATATLADLTGPGVITHIWMTLYQESFSWAREGWSPDGTANPQEVLLRMYWDGRENPDVEAPLGDFFAACFGEPMAVRSIPVIVEDGDSFNCYWRMPFRKSARLEVVNQSAKPVCLLYYAVDWIQKESLPPETLYFCARHRQEYPTPGQAERADSEYLILDTQGPGYYVGTVLAVRTRSPDWFGEGDIRISIDGEPAPSIWGTGTEDYFLSAWGQKICLEPYFGTPFLNHAARDVGQMSCCYRWHIQDPIVFKKSIRVAIEAMGWLNVDENPEGVSRKYGQRQDDYSSVAFWYQLGPSKPFAPSTTAEQRRLPGLERVLVWGSDFRAAAHHGRGSVRVRSDGVYLDKGGLLQFVPESPDEGWLEVPFTVREKEPLRLILVLDRSTASGMYQPVLSGVKLREPLDLYSEQPGLHEFQIMDFWPEPGDYVLRLEHAGRNPRSTGDAIGVNSVRLRERRPRVREIGYLKDHDWRSEQILVQRTTRPRAATTRPGP